MAIHSDYLGISMKKIGIIVVFYNLSHYVEECLNSIKNQSFADFKCICVDDRSTDDTFEKLQQFATNDDRFIAIQNEKNYGSPCHSRNVGIENVSDCEYFMFMDGDDLLHPQTMEICFNAIEKKSELDFVAFNTHNFKNTNELNLPEYLSSSIQLHTYTNPLELFLTRSPASSQPNAINKLYRYHSYRNFRFFEDLFYEEDCLYALQTLAKTKISGRINLPLYFYRRHEASVTSGLRAERYLNDATTRLKHTYDYFIISNNIPSQVDTLFKQQMANDAYRMIVSKIIRKTKSKELRDQLIPVAQRNFKKLIDEKIINLNHLSFANRLVIKAFLNDQLGLAKLLAKIFG